jgi:hypothetical protein
MSDYMRHDRQRNNAYFATARKKEQLLRSSVRLQVWKADLSGASQSFAGQNGAVLCAAFSNQPTPCLLSVGEANAIVRWRLSTLAVREPLG